MFSQLYLSSGFFVLFCFYLVEGGHQILWHFLGWSEWSPFLFSLASPSQFSAIVFFLCWSTLTLVWLFWWSWCTWPDETILTLCGLVYLGLFTGCYIPCFIFWLPPLSVHLQVQACQWGAEEAWLASREPFEGGGVMPLTSSIVAQLQELGASCDKVGRFSFSAMWPNEKHCFSLFSFSVIPLFTALPTISSLLQFSTKWDRQQQIAPQPIYLQ